MKIGIVCYPTYGGSGVIATELGKALAKNDHEVHFISYAQPFRLDIFDKNIYYHEVIVKDYPLFVHPPYILSLAGKMVEIVKYQKLDLLHVHYAVPHATAADLARQILRSEGIHIPIITTLHGTDINLVGKDETFMPIITHAINVSDGVTAVSQSLKDNTLSFFPKVNKEITVIPNFIDLQRFSYKPKNHFKKAIAPNDEKIIVHASNFRRLKRVDNVVRIFAQIHDKIPSKLLLIGDGPERAKIEKQCRELGLYDSAIRFLGKQDAIEELLAVSDLFLMPSETESFGLAALEAMACQVPVVSSNVEGLPEVNLHGITGYTAPPDDVAQMAELSLKILGNPDTLAQFRHNALLQAQKYDIKNILPQYEAYYQKIVAQHHSQQS
jgi:N-acetyl-alpha-D-glucosaminyl L-malate synthase BshA